MQLEEKVGEVGGRGGPVAPWQRATTRKSGESSVPAEEDAPLKKTDIQVHPRVARDYRDNEARGRDEDNQKSERMEGGEQVW